LKLSKKYNLNSFERTTLKQTFKLVRENGKWRFRCNEALFGEYKDWNFVSYTKFSKYKQSL